MFSFSKLTGNVKCWPKGLCNMSPQTEDVYMCLKTVTWKICVLDMLKSVCYYIICMFYLLWNCRTASETNCQFLRALTRNSLNTNIERTLKQLELADSLVVNVTVNRLLFNLKTGTNFHISEIYYNTALLLKQKCGMCLALRLCVYRNTFH